MYIKVHIHPKAKKPKIEERKPLYFDVYVKEKAERNLANNALIKLLSEYFNVSDSQIRIISGHHNRSKLISIRE